MNPSRPSFAPEIEPEVLATLSPGPAIAERQIPAPDQALLLARMLWEHRQFVAGVILRGTLLALIVALLIPATYQSETQLMPPEQHAGALGALAAMAGSSGSGSSSSGGAGGGALGMVGDLLGMKTTGALFISMLKSETIQDDMIDRFDLRKVYWVRTYNSARKKLASRTDINEDKKSGVISITVTDHDPQRATDLARAYVEELNHMVVDLDTSSAHRERVFLEGRLKVVKQELDASSKAFSEFASKNTAIDIKEQGKAMVDAAAVLKGQLIAAQSELSGLEQIYTSENVRVRLLHARVEELQHQLGKLGGSAADTSSGATSDQMYPSIRQLPVLGVPYYDLRRDIEINEKVFEVLTKEYETARVEEAKEVPSVKVMDLAKHPEKRSGPPRTLITTVGAFLSFFLAAAWLFGKEAWRSWDAQDPRKMLVEEVASSVTQHPRWQRTQATASRIIPDWFFPRVGNNSHGNNGNGAT
ncbi:MAG: GNVR domain-containing protein [Terriglobales bacterium]